MKTIIYLLFIPAIMLTSCSRYCVRTCQTEGGHHLHKAANFLDDSVTAYVTDSVTGGPARRYFILHANGDRYHLLSQELLADGSLQATWEAMKPNERTSYPGDRKCGRLEKSNGQHLILQEVHLYADTVQISGNETLTVPAGKLVRIDEIRKKTYAWIPLVVIPVGLVCLVGASMSLTWHMGFGGMQ